MDEYICVAEWKSPRHAASVGAWCALCSQPNIYDPCCVAGGWGTYHNQYKLCIYNYYTAAVTINCIYYHHLTHCSCCRIYLYSVTG